MIGLAFDSLYVLWNHFVSRNNVHLAAVVSMAIAGVGALGTLRIVEDHWSIVPQALGLGAGTYLGMWIKRRFRWNG